MRGTDAIFFTSLSENTKTSAQSLHESTVQHKLWSICICTEHGGPPKLKNKSNVSFFLQQRLKGYNFSLIYDMYVRQNLKFKNLSKDVCFV